MNELISTFSCKFFWLWIPELTFLLRKLLQNTELISTLNILEHGLNTRMYRSEVYPEPCQISKMVVFAKIANVWQPLTFSQKTPCQIFDWVLNMFLVCMFRYSIHSQDYARKIKSCILKSFTQCIEGKSIKDIFNSFSQTILT